MGGPRGTTSQAAGDCRALSLVCSIPLGKQTKTGRVVTKKHQPGNSAIMIHLTCNRFADRWKTSREVVTKKESYDSSPSERNTKAIKSLARDILEADTDKPEGERKLPATTS